MTPEAPNPEVPAQAPSEQPAPDAALDAPALPEAPVLPGVPEVTTETTPPPVAEEAQAADRMIGNPPGMTTEDLTSIARETEEATVAASNANTYNANLSPATVRSTPLQPPAPLPSFSTAEQQPVPLSTSEAPVSTPTPDTTPETQQ